VRMVALSDYDLKIAKKKKKLSSVNAEWKSMNFKRQIKVAYSKTISLHLRFFHFKISFFTYIILTYRVGF
jgi:hypothetical protein